MPGDHRQANELLVDPSCTDECTSTKAYAWTNREDDYFPFVITCGAEISIVNPYTSNKVELGILTMEQAIEFRWLSPVAY